MKKKLSILFVFIIMLSCMPVQSNAGVLSSKLSSAIAKVQEKIDSAFSKVKEKISESKAKKANESESSTKTEKTSVKSKVSNAFSSALSKARSTLQSAFNMNFLSSVPVVFWKKSFNTMFEYTQNSVDKMSVEYNGELITRNDFQDDKALHIKKSAELALHIKSLFGSSVFAYGVTLAIGGIKELIDSSFLNPNGGRCWEDFYADMVGASAVFGEKAFDKKLNKYMDSFLKENRTVNKVDDNNFQDAKSVVANSPEIVEDYEQTKKIETTDTIITEKSDGLADSALERQRLTTEYYNAVKSGDTEAIKTISNKLQNLK